MIVIIDYGAGNLRSVYNAFEVIGQSPLVTNNPLDLNKASAIVLPGVGAFGDGMASLRRLNLIEHLNEEVIVKKKPYLGICLGLQFLAQKSTEIGQHRGLGWINGTVELIKPKSREFHIPHIGWNDLIINKPSPLFTEIENPIFYFVHSYHLQPDTDFLDVVSSTVWHGVLVTASVQYDNIFGVQFHPEKSQESGLKLLENFVKFI